MDMGKTIVIYDTEFTTWKGAMDGGWGGERQHREVFMIGARAWAEGSDWREGQAFVAHARPVLNPVLDPYATDLTGVSQADIDAADSLETVLENMDVLYGPEVRYFSNGNDINPLAESAGLQRFVLPIDPRRFGNLHAPLYAALREEVGEVSVRQYPSGMVYKVLGLELGSTQVHDAMHDVDSLCITIEELMRRGHDFGFLWK
jgi:hypothetical protein